MATGIDFWGPGRAKWGQQLESVFEGVPGCRRHLLRCGVTQVNLKLQFSTVLGEILEGLGPQNKVFASEMLQKRNFH